MTNPLDAGLSTSELAKERLERIRRAEDQDADATKSGPFYRPNSLMDAIERQKRENEVPNPPKAPDAKTMTDKFLRPGTDTQPHQGKPADRKGLEEYIGE